jgi:hypothetical protein
MEGQNELKKNWQNSTKGEKIKVIFFFSTMLILFVLIVLMIFSNNDDENKRVQNDDAIKFKQKWRTQFDKKK